MFSYLPSSSEDTCFHVFILTGVALLRSRVCVPLGALFVDTVFSYGNMEYSS